jgi:hypothetical protein
MSELQSGSGEAQEGSAGNAEGESSSGGDRPPDGA